MLKDAKTDALIRELENRLLTAEAAAVYLNTHVSYVWKLLKDEKLRTIKIFNRTLFERTSLKEELARRKARAARPKVQPSEDEELAKTPYDHWNVRTLQRECKYRGLRVRGRKAELIERILADDEK